MRKSIAEVQASRNQTARRVTQPTYPIASDETQVRTSSSDAPLSKRWPSVHVPASPPASDSSPVALSPTGDEIEVQNGITVLPAKSLPATKPFVGHAAMPHQMG